jgi:CRP/FNR family transcriptional regulator
MEEVIRFVRSQPQRLFKKGEILVYQGDEPEALYGIISGFVKAHDVSKDGIEQFIWLAKHRDVIPLEWLFALTKKSPFFYTAFTDVTAYMIDKQQFLDVIKDKSDALLVIAEAISTKYSHIAQHLNAAQKPRAREKLMHLLNFIAMRFTQADPDGMERVEVPFTHQDIASLLGLTRETTTLALHRLKDEGYVSYDKNRFYIDRKKLSQALN